MDYWLLETCHMQRCSENACLCEITWIVTICWSLQLHPIVDSMNIKYLSMNFKNYLNKTLIRSWLMKFWLSSRSNSRMAWSWTVWWSPWTVLCESYMHSMYSWLCEYQQTSSDLSSPPILQMQCSYDEQLDCFTEKFFVAEVCKLASRPAATRNAVKQTCEHHIATLRGLLLILSCMLSVQLQLRVCPDSLS